MGGALLTSTVEKAVVHRFMGASTSASSFFDCIRHAESQQTHSGHQAFVLDTLLDSRGMSFVVETSTLAAVT